MASDVGTNFSRLVDAAITGKAIPSKDPKSADSTGARLAVSIDPMPGISGAQVGDRFDGDAGALIDAARKVFGRGDATAEDFSAFNRAVGDSTMSAAARSELATIGLSSLAQRAQSAVNAVSPRALTDEAHANAMETLTTLIESPALESEQPLRKALLAKALAMRAFVTKSAVWHGVDGLEAKGLPRPRRPDLPKHHIEKAAHPEAKGLPRPRRPDGVPDEAPATMQARGLADAERALELVAELGDRSKLPAVASNDARSALMDVYRAIRADGYVEPVEARLLDAIDRQVADGQEGFYGRDFSAFLPPDSPRAEKTAEQLMAALRTAERAEEGSERTAATWALEKINDRIENGDEAERLVAYQFKYRVLAGPRDRVSREIRELIPESDRNTQLIEAASYILENSDPRWVALRSDVGAALLYSVDGESHPDWGVEIGERILAGFERPPVPSWWHRGALNRLVRQLGDARPTETAALIDTFTEQATRIVADRPELRDRYVEFLERQANWDSVQNPEVLAALKRTGSALAYTKVGGNE